MTDNAFAMLLLAFQISYMQTPAPVLNFNLFWSDCNKFCLLATIHIWEPGENNPI